MKAENQVNDKRNEAKNRDEKLDARSSKSCRKVKQIGWTSLGVIRISCSIKNSQQLFLDILNVLAFYRTTRCSKCRYFLKRCFMFPTIYKML